MIPRFFFQLQLKLTLFKEYPAWNMIGGKIILKNISGSKVA